MGVAIEIVQQAHLSSGVPYLSIGLFNYCD
jgi:hypothetical protein